VASGRPRMRTLNPHTPFRHEWQHEHQLQYTALDKAGARKRGQAPANKRRPSARSPAWAARRWTSAATAGGRPAHADQADQGQGFVELHLPARVLVIARIRSRRASSAYAQQERDPSSRPGEDLEAHPGRRAARRRHGAHASLGDVYSRHPRARSRETCRSARAPVDMLRRGRSRCGWCAARSCTRSACLVLRSPCCPVLVRRAKSPRVPVEEPEAPDLTEILMASPVAPELLVATRRRRGGVVGLRILWFPPSGRRLIDSLWHRSPT